jgi:Tfp pilus assembly protein PilO
VSRRGIALAVLGAVLVAAVWWVFFISPRNSDISDLDGQITTAEDQEAILRAELKQLQDIAASELTYRSAIGQLETSIPEDPDIADFIESLDLLAAETGVNLLGVAQAVPVLVEGGTFYEIGVSIAIDGQYFEVLGFMFGLSDLERLVVVDSVSLSPIEPAEEAEEEEAAPVEGEETTTSSTTTTTLPQQEGLLDVTLTGAVYTRTPLLVTVTPPAEEGSADAPAEEGAEGEATTTTVVEG